MSLGDVFWRSIAKSLVNIHVDRHAAILGSGPGNLAEIKDYEKK